MEVENFQIFSLSHRCTQNYSVSANLEEKGAATFKLLLCKGCFKNDQQTTNNIIRRIMKRDWKRKLIGGLCLTSVAFVFQACYGTPQDFGNDLLVEGLVKSKMTGLPIQGIKVSVADRLQYTHTDGNGKFSFYTEKIENTKIKFEDIDSTENAPYSNKDTLLTIKEAKVYLNIELENK